MRQAIKGQLTIMWVRAHEIDDTDEQMQEEIKLLEQIENTPEYIKTWRKLIFVWQRGNQEADKKAKQVIGRQMIRKEWQMIRNGGKVNRITMTQYTTKRNMERKSQEKIYHNL